MIISMSFFEKSLWSWRQRHTCSACKGSWKLSCISSATHNKWLLMIFCQTIVGVRHNSHCWMLPDQTMLVLYFLLHCRNPFSFAFSAITARSLSLQPAGYFLTKIQILKMTIFYPSLVSQLIQSVLKYHLKNNTPSGVLCQSLLMEIIHDKYFTVIL